MKLNQMTPEKLYEILTGESLFVDDGLPGRARTRKPASVRPITTLESLGIVYFWIKRLQRDLGETIPFDLQYIINHIDGKFSEADFGGVTKNVQDLVNMIHRYN